MIQIMMVMIMGWAWCGVLGQCQPDGVYTYETLGRCAPSVPGGAVPTIRFWQAQFSATVIYPYTNLTIIGSEIVDLSGLVNATFVGAPAAWIEISGTSLVNLTGLPPYPSNFPLATGVAANVLYVHDNPLLTSLAMPLLGLPVVYVRRNPLITSLQNLWSSILGAPLAEDGTVVENFNYPSSFVDVTQCDGIETVVGPSFPLNLGIRFTDNAQLTSVVGFDGVPSAIYIAPPSDPNLASIEFSNNPMLTTISVFPSVTDAPSIVLRNNSRLMSAGGIGVKIVTGSFIIDSNPSMTSLGTGMTSIAALYVTNQPSMTDWSALTRLTVKPTVFSAAGSACPPYTFWPTSVLFTPLDFDGCIDQLTVTAVSLLRGPVTGGVLVQLTLRGILAAATVNATFGAGQCICMPATNPQMQMQFDCIVPPSGVEGTFPIAIRVSADRPWLASAFAFSYVSVAAAFGADLSLAAAYVPAPYASSTPPVPGLPQSQTNQVTAQTDALVTTVAVLVGCFVCAVLVLALYVAEHKWSKTVLAGLVWIDALKYLREDASDRTRTTDGFIVRRQGSIISGTITVVAAAVGLTAVAALAIQFALDNTTVSTTLLPVNNALLAMRSSYAAIIQMVGSTLCATDQLSISVSGFAIVTPTAGDGVSCQSTSNGCLVTYKCASCTTTSSSPAISISDPSPNSFVLSYAFTFAAVDYFGQPSIASGSISAALNSTLKGAASPATADITLTPATFNSYGTITAGVLAAAVGTDINGGQVALDAFGTQSGVAFTLGLSANQNALGIQLTRTTSPLSAIAQAGALLSSAVALGSVLVSAIFTLRRHIKNALSPPVADKHQPQSAELVV